jgi:hypothetical protein
MEQNHYNLKKLVRIEVQDFQRFRAVKYQEKRTFLGLTIQEEGWYGWMYIDKIPVEQYLQEAGYKLERLVIKEKEILEKPHVVLHFQDKHGKIQYFETLQDAQDFAANIKDLVNTNWITD